MRLSRLEGAANRRVGTESDKDAHFGVCRGKNARLATEQRVRSVNEQGRVAWTRPLKLPIHNFLEPFLSGECDDLT